MSRLDKIAVAKIEKTENALREVIMDNEGFQEILASVRKHGVLMPITVRSTDDPELFELVDGRHRLTAAVEAGLTEIPCHIYDGMDDKTQLSQQLISNAARVDTKPAEYGKQIKRLLTLDPLLTKHDLAAELGKSPQWIDKVLRIQTLPQAVADAIDDGSICLQNALALADLPEEEQEEWIKRAIDMPAGEFVPEANARARQIREDKRKGKEAAPEVFEARPKVRKGALILEEHTSSSVIENLCKKGAEQQGARKILDWICQMDEETVTALREKWEAARLQREETKARKAQEKLAAEKEKNEKRNAEIQEQMAGAEG